MCLRSVAAKRSRPTALLFAAKPPPYLAFDVRKTPPSAQSISQRLPRSLYVAKAIIWAYLVIGVAAFYLQFRGDL